MNGNGRIDASEFLVQIREFVIDLHCRSGGMQGMPCRAFLALEDHHEPIASGFIDIPMIGANDLQKTRKIILNETIQALRWQMLRQARVALHIETQHRDIRFAFFEFLGVRILF